MGNDVHPLWPPSETVELKTTAHDKSHEMAVASSAAWFFKGEPPMDHIRERVAELLQLNPWLAGQYVKGKWLYPRTVCGGVVPCAGMMERHLLEGEEDLSAAMGNYISLNQKLLAYGCLPANKLKGNNEKPAFVVAVVKDKGAPGSFALVVSVNHMLADGGTMYNIAGMLSAGAKVTALIAERLPYFVSVQEKVVGKDEKAMFSFGNMGFLFGLVGGMVKDLASGKNRDLVMCELDEGWIKRRKEEGAREAGLPFVSTNDAVTSLVLSDLIPASVGLMEVSLRGKDPELIPATDEHAGNYTVMVPYFLGDAAKPGDVRRSLRPREGAQHFVAKRHGGSPVPGFFGMMSGKGRYVAITNWASIDRPVELPGCETTLHLPMMDMLVPSPFDGAVVWKPAPGKTALLAFCRKKGHLPDSHEAFGPGILGFSKVQRAAQAGAA